MMRSAAAAASSAAAAAAGWTTTRRPAALLLLHHQQHQQRRWRPSVASAASSAAAAAAGGAGGGPDALAEWVVRSGGAVRGVAAADLKGADGGSGWGLVATGDVPTSAGARLIELPRRCMLTYDEGSDPRLLALVARVPDELWGAKLALQLLAQRVRGADSPFAAYVAQLPVGVAGLPMFFPREALEALEYPPVVEQVKRRGRWLHRFASDRLAGLPEAPADDPFNGVHVDTNSLGWALGVVTSRAFRVAGPTAPAALLPLVDMANHSFEPNCEVVPVQGGVAMVSKRKLAAGEPLLLSYGRLSNDFLLMDYGFVAPGNEHDRVALRFDVDLVNAAALAGGARNADGGLLQLPAQLPPWRQRHLERLGLLPGDRVSGGKSGGGSSAGSGGSGNLQVLLGGPADVEPRLLAAVRGLVATFQSEVEALTPAVLGSWDRPLNKQNEAATIRVLIGMAMVALQGFSTGVDADRALLAGSGFGYGSGEAAAPPPPSSSSPDPQQQPQQLQPPPPLTPEMRLALTFRAERKQLLVDVIARLAGRLKASARLRGLREAPVAAAKPGARPRPTTSKGFGGGA